MCKAKGLQHFLSLVVCQASLWKSRQMSNDQRLSVTTFQTSLNTTQAETFLFTEICSKNSATVNMMK